MSDKSDDIWIKPSFGSPLNYRVNQIRYQNAKQKAKKRSSKEAEIEEIETNLSDNSKDNSISLLDSLSVKDRSELAVSKIRSNQLSEWFRQQFVVNHFESRFLVMTGPTGAGKTTSLKLLAKEFNVEVIEYKNYSQEVETYFDEELVERKNYSSDVTQLEDFKKFITDAIRFKTRLDFWSNDVAIGNTSHSESHQLSHRLILIEEFPNIFLLKPEALHKELRLLEKRFGKRLIPIVFIISETINGHSEEYRLVPKPLQTELRMKNISFCPITECSLRKTLQRLSDNQLEKNEIQNLIDGSSGDIRCAINNMKLLFMHSIDNYCDKSGKKCRKMSEKVSNNDYLWRDRSLHTYHAIGKVLYAKRIHLGKQSEGDNPDLHSVYKLPPHLSDKERLELECNADSIAEKSIVSSDVFNAWLHQNYLGFCDSLECAQNCIDWLCESDALFSGEHHFNNKPIFDSYKSSLAIRGLSFNLPASNQRAKDANQASNGFPLKPKLGANQFKAFTKPQTYVVNRLVNSLERQIRESLSQNRLFWSTSSVVIDLMPFISQMPKHLQTTDKSLRNILDKIVSYEHNSHEINEHQLCNALSLSSVSDYRCDQTNDEIIFQNNTNEDKNGANVIQINTQAIDGCEYTVEDSDDDY